MPDANTAAALAATLAAGRPIDKVSAAALAGQAIDLWQATRRALGERFAAGLVAYDKSAKFAREYVPVPRGVSFPLPWLDFGKALRPKSKDEHIGKWLREWAEAANVKMQPMENEFDFHHFAAQFLAWLPDHQKKLRRERAKKGAVGKAEKGWPRKAAKAASKKVASRKKKLDPITPGQKVIQAPFTVPQAKLPPP